MTSRYDCLFSGKFVKVTFGWNRARNFPTYKIEIQDGLTDSSYPRGGGTLAKELSGAADAIRFHQSENADATQPPYRAGIAF